MDWKRVENLIGVDVDTFVSRASDAGAALAALIDRIRAEARTVEVGGAALRDRLDAVPGEIETQRALVKKCDAIIVKAEGDGRADLAAAARAKKAGAEAQIADLEAELRTAKADIPRAGEAVGQLQHKAEVVQERYYALGLVATLPAVAAVSEAALKEEGAPLAVPAAAVSAPPAAVPPPSQPEPSGGDDDLDAAFAALMVDTGDDTADAAPSPEPDDDDELELPDLVEVADGELPEGADPEDDGPIDFSALDALVAKEAGLPAPKEKKKGKPPAKKEAKAPAKKDAPEAAAAAGEERSRKGLWIAVGGAAIAIGGTLAALIGFGVL